MDPFDQLGQAARPPVVQSDLDRLGQAARASAAHRRWPSPPRRSALAAIAQVILMLAASVFLFIGVFEFRTFAAGALDRPDGELAETLQGLVLTIVFYRGLTSIGMGLLMIGCAVVIAGQQRIVDAAHAGNSRSL